jgi:hypothetical protein
VTRLTRPIKEATTMAKVTGPLLSLHAHGLLKGVGVFQSWKTQSVIRQPFNPNRPDSPDQLEQNAAITAATAFFRAHAPDPVWLDSWSRYAKATNWRWHAANAVTRLAAPAYRQTPSNQFVSAWTALPSMRLQVTFVRLDGTAPNQQPAGARLYYSTDPNRIADYVTPDAGGDVTIFSLPLPAGTTVYAFVTLSLFRVSGDVKIAILAPPANYFANPGFTADTDWIKTSPWTIHDGRAYRATGISPLCQDLTALTLGHSYKITFTLVASGASSTCRPILGTTTGTYRGTPGTYSETLTLAGNKRCGFGGNPGSPRSNQIDDAELLDA